MYWKPFERFSLPSQRQTHRFTFHPKERLAKFRGEGGKENIFSAKAKIAKDKPSRILLAETNADTTSYKGRENEAK